jgi:signal transduction histidine kinase
LAFVDSAERKWTDFKTTTRRGKEIDISWFIVRRPDGSSIAIGQDISQRKKEEEEKALLLRQLAIQNNDLVQFSFIASHNLRGPVATMLGLTQILKQLKIEDPELLRILSYLYTSADKLNEVIKDLNTVLEIRNDHFQAKQWVTMQDAFNQIMKTFDNKFDVQMLDIRTDFSACTQFFTISSYFHNILYNLVSNAIKFRSPDRKPVITIRTFKTKLLAGFSVEDNGIGLDLEQFGQKLFTLYQRFHLEFEGKGLGLYLVRTQVYSLNGSIDVASKPGEGTVFTVSFPLPDTLKI